MNATHILHFGTEKSNGNASKQEQFSAFFPGPGQSISSIPVTSLYHTLTKFYNMFRYQQYIAENTLILCHRVIFVISRNHSVMFSGF